MQKILLIDDDPTFGLMLQSFLKKNNFETIFTKSGEEAMEEAKSQKFDIILCDFMLPKTTGLEILKRLRSKNIRTPFLLMTSYANIRTAVSAIKMGAFEYITKPINPDEVLAAINDAILAESYKRQKYNPDQASFDFVKGESDMFKMLEKHIQLVAPTKMSVLIQGESGTGKENISRLIHTKSQQKNRPFVAINCGALSKELAASELFGHIKGSFTGAVNDKKGQFEVANGGTLFLDEIGNLSYDIQIQLLRAMQEQTIKRVGGNTDIPVNVRVLAATNENLYSAVKKGEFSEDLYHRLNEFEITVPPLRERGNDILLFAKYFLNKANKELNKRINGFDDRVENAFLKYPWPGNIRELKNVVKRMVLLESGTKISLQNLPDAILDPKESIPENGLEGGFHNTTIQSAPETGQTLRSITERQEKELIINTLEKVKYNKSKAARILDIDRKTLYNKLKQYNIEL